MGLKERLEKLEGRNIGSAALLIIEKADRQQGESESQTLSRLKAERDISETALIIWS